LYIHRLQCTFRGATLHRPDSFCGLHAGRFP
jgi:hypothetical protein